MIASVRIRERPTKNGLIGQYVQVDFFQAYSKRRSYYGFHLVYMCGFEALQALVKFRGLCASIDPYAKVGSADIC